VVCECGALVGEVLVLWAKLGEASANASAAPLEKILKVRCFMVKASCGYTFDSPCESAQHVPRFLLSARRLDGIAARADQFHAAESSDEPGVRVRGSRGEVVTRVGNTV
jgi:hypothetical protein